MPSYHQPTDGYSRKQRQALSLRSLFRSESHSHDIMLIKHWQQQADKSVADGINRAIDDMLIDMAINGFVLDGEQSEVAAELGYMRRRNQIPADSQDETMKKLKLTCEVPRIVRPTPKALRVMGLKAGEIDGSAQSATKVKSR